MTFEQWWKEYLKDNLSCINYHKDFKACWDAATIVSPNEKMKDCGKCPEGWINPDCKVHSRVV